MHLTLNETRTQGKHDAVNFFIQLYKKKTPTPTPTQGMCTFATGSLVC